MKTSLLASSSSSAFRQMQITLLAFICLLPLNAGFKAQAYDGAAQHMYFLSQPSARLEAMGRAGAALSGSPLMAFYNPASSSFLDMVSLEVSHLELYNPMMLDDQRYDTYSAGINLGRYGAFSLGYLRCAWGYEIRIPAMLAQSENEKVTPAAKIYLMNYSYSLYEGLSAGINLNYYEDDYKAVVIKGWMFDAGLMKRFSLNTSSGNQDLYLGLSVTNLFNGEFEDGRYITYYLPSIMRFGAAYEFQPLRVVSDLNILNILVSAEYSDLLNSGDYSQYKIGTELTIMEILKVRGGWFTEKMPAHDNRMPWDVDRISEFTYGFGIEVPVKKISGIELPLIVRFDHTFMDSPKFYQYQGKHKICPVYSLNAAYDFSF